MRTRSWLYASLLVVATACGKSSQQAPAPGQAPKGLPPAGENTPTPAAAEGKVTGAPDPHAGMDMGGADNPHAGMGAPAESPHAAAMAGGSDDPTLSIAGTLEAGGGFADKIKAGDVVYLTAKTADPKTGEPTGGALAVSRVVIDKLPQPYQLGLSAKPAGDVVVTARVDHDNEARTRTAGDIEGFAKATVPAKDLKVVLDKPVQ